MNKLNLGLKALVAFLVIAAIMFVAPSIGRYTPTHLIIQEVYCGSCHPEEVSELGSSGAHLGHFAGQINASVKALTGQPDPAALAISGGCTMCHNYWDNMEWFGVNNFSVTKEEQVDPIPITDIYGNAVSPYGLSSTSAFSVTTNGYNGTTGLGDIEPWAGGLGVYQYTNKTGLVKSRLDYVWSNLSALSPGPAKFGSGGCGTVEKGMCHFAAASVALSEAGSRYEYPAINATDIVGGVNGNASSNTGGIPGKTSQTGSGVFFRHEMAYTTAQYAAKPVKLCGACHVFKLPPMSWGGEPWSEQVIKEVSATGDNTGLLGIGSTGVQGTAKTVAGDPFGFTPLYPQVGQSTLEYESHSGNVTFNVAYKTPDWAHANVPCIRCHTHAGVNGETVSDNTGTPS